MGRIFGVQVFVDWSWVVTFVFAAAMLVSLNARLWPELGNGIVIAASLLAAAGLFASLGAHQLIRVMAARGAGLPVHSLTLFVLGGITDVERAPATPRTEVLGAVAACAASLVAALVLAIGVGIASAPLPDNIADLDRLGLPGVVLLEIAAANLAILVVHLLPAFPLDGGRLLRALLWKTTHDVDRATRISAWAGQVLGFTAVLVGIAVGLIGNPLIGLFTAFLGWFIASAAAQGYERFSGKVRTTAAP